jgi:predicted amidophosphoribosyltransferase
MKGRAGGHAPSHNSRRTPFQLRRWLWVGLDFVFPPRCVSCGRLGFRLRPDRRTEIVWLGAPLCIRCGTPLHVASRAEGHTCIHEPSLRAVRSAALFDGPIRDALHVLKKRRDLGLAEAMAQVLLEVWRKLDWRVDESVPVPRGAKRLRERGYNQAALLAHTFGVTIDVPVSEKLLVR